ncbi:hypothetical protein IMZ11_01635 [Microtetraspora sp. AC03309]|uniref:TcpE family conjugal transfer membrane protein n=1 Tax=Microtetraspora sp. AC03309 TaxID=2779376 RepID=UPI001E5DCEB3|nr:TcpE family conjugal transfer membrane protein [Microtetraspora sp. AC03309]MCC5574342.1 hypothetical protein [Microtetraspora sp. AC03309]
MDLPTYTNIWRIEKRLYKLYDLKLPTPLPIVWIGVFVGVLVPWWTFLFFVGLPFDAPWHVVYLVPPGIVTWLSTRPVIEGKRLTELLQSQVRYLAEPRTWCRMAPVSEPDEITLTVRVWRSAPAVKGKARSRQRRAAASTVRPAVAAAAKGAVAVPAVAEPVAVPPPMPLPAPGATSATAQGAGSAPVLGVGSVPAAARGGTTGAAARPAADRALPRGDRTVAGAAGAAGYGEPAVPPIGPDALRKLRRLAASAQDGTGERERERRVREQPVRELGLPAAEPRTHGAERGAVPEREASEGASPRLPQKVWSSTATPTTDGHTTDGSASGARASDGPASGGPVSGGSASALSASGGSAPDNPVSGGSEAERPAHEAPRHARAEPVWEEPWDAAHEPPRHARLEAVAGEAWESEHEPRTQADEEPAVRPAPEPVTRLAERRAEPAREPVREPVGQAAEETATAPAVEPTTRARVEIASKRAARPVGGSEALREPVSEPARESASELVSETASETASESVSGPVRELASEESAGELISGPASEPVREPAREPVRESVRARVGESPKEHVREPAREPVREQVGESAKGHVREPVREPVRAPADAPPVPVSIRAVAPGDEPKVRRVESVVGRDTSGGWRRIAQVVVGGGGGRTDGMEIDEARARSVLTGSRRILVLGCTGGAGQTTTTLMLGHTFAKYRDDRVLALDASTGAQTLTTRITADSPETLSSLLAGSGGVSGYLGMRSYTTRCDSGLEVVGADSDAGAAQRLEAGWPRMLSALDRHYRLIVVDPAAALAARLLPYADQLVLVAPASEDAPDAVAMTYEWLDGHGCSELRRRAVMVVNGVSRRSASDVEQAEAVARGRCRAIVRIPWEDELSRQGPVDPARLRPGGRRAYVALAGVIASGLAANQHKQEVAR